MKHNAEKVPDDRRTDGQTDPSVSMKGHFVMTTQSSGTSLDCLCYWVFWHSVQANIWTKSQRWLFLSLLSLLFSSERLKRFKMFCSSSRPKLLFTGKFHFERLQLLKMISGFRFHYVWCTIIKISNQFSIECFRATVNVWIKSMNIQMSLYPSFHFLLLSGSESHGQQSEQRPLPRPPPHSHLFQLFGAPEGHNVSNMPWVCPKSCFHFIISQTLHLEEIRETPSAVSFGCEGVAAELCAPHLISKAQIHQHLNKIRDAWILHLGQLLDPNPEWALHLFRAGDHGFKRTGFFILLEHSVLYTAHTFRHFLLHGSTF